MTFCSKTFEELTKRELYEILKARAAIFIMEQQINYQDLDDIDYDALHCFLQDDGQIVAYLRAFPDPDEEGAVRIGRVLTLQHGKGLGKLLMEYSLTAIEERLDYSALTMDAQQHAIGFYEPFGFVTVSEPFLEEGIIHVKMRKES